MSRRDLLLAGGALVLLAIGILRLATPDRPRIRAVAIEGVSTKPRPVGPGETVTEEGIWQPPDDVYVLGWDPIVGAGVGQYDVDIMLYESATQTTLFHATQSVSAGSALHSWPATTLPLGTGYLARKGSPLKFRIMIGNTGTTTVQPRAASALIYYVRVEGN